VELKMLFKNQIVSLILVLIMISMGTPIIRVTKKPVVIQQSEIPSATQLSSSYSTNSDITANVFLETEWNTLQESPERISKINESSSQDSLAEFMQIAPFVPIESMENASLSDSSKSTIAGTTLSYFQGHTWSWEFGSDDHRVEAPEVIRPLEGNWFPKESYARIVYQVWVTGGMKFHFRIERGADPLARIFRLYLNEEEVKRYTIWNSQDYYDSTYVVDEFIVEGWYWVTLQINYGAYVEKGWSLRYWLAQEEDDEDIFQPVRTEYQQFRKKTHSELVFEAPMGPTTKLNIETVNCHDPWLRYLYVYVDGTRKATIYAPGAYEVNLGDWSTPGMHELKIELYYGDHFTGAYSKSLKYLYVSYDYRHVEVDSMTGHDQPQWVYDYVEAYYRTHDYRRVTFHPDQDDLPHQDMINEYVWADYYNDYAGDLCKASTRWSWGLYCHRFWYEYGGHEVWGLGEVGGKKFVIADYCSDDNSRDWILMHEFGHTEKMLDYSGYKHDCYSMETYGYQYMDWDTPHYACSSWTSHLEWISGWW
jgi:hypothetical protein